MADISKITLPGGTTYDIKDAVARNAISNLNNWTYVIASNAETTPSGVIWNNGSMDIIGTLAASANTLYKIYLVPSTNGMRDIYDEYITINTTGTTYIWEMFGNTDVNLSDLRDMAKVDQGIVSITPKGTNSSSSVTFVNNSTDTVLGENTTFTNSSSTVEFGPHTTVEVLTSGVTATVPAIAGRVKYLTAGATGGSVSVATSSDAITSLGTPSTEAFVKSYPGATSKLAQITVIGVESTTTTASKANAGTAKDVAKAKASTTAVASGSLGEETSTRGVNTPMWGASVNNEILSFTFKPIETTNITEAESNGTITPYTFDDVTVPVKNANATTVATGAVSSSGTGGTVMTGLGTAVTADGVTGYSPTSETFAKTVSMGTQPTITLQANGTNEHGGIEFIDAIRNIGTDNVTFNIVGHTADAITGLGNATANPQTITVGANDKVTAITGLGTGTAAAQVFEGTTETYTVDPKFKNEIVEP